MSIDKFVLGCGSFGTACGSNPKFWGQGESESDAFKIMNAAWDLGIRHFDTAELMVVV